MSSTNKTTHYELSQYIGTDKPTYLGDYNSDMVKIDAAIHNAADNASTAVSTANSAASTASDAATAASAAKTTANNADKIANLAKTTAETASTNASAALKAAQGAQTAAAANDITNLAPAYDSTLTYAVDDLVTYVDGNGTGKLYKCIVAVVSPMKFNINYWDDVTVSEVFSSKIIARAYGNGVKTTKELLEELHSIISNSFTVDKGYKLIRIYNGNNDQSIFEYNTDRVDVSADEMRFFSCHISASNIIIESVHVAATSHYYKSVDGTINTNEESFAPPSTVSYAIIKE